MKLSAKSRFTTIMVATASIAMTLVGAIAWFEARHSLKEAEFTHLTSVRVAKSRQVEEYFQMMRDQLSLMSADKTVISAMVQISRGYRRLGEKAVPQNYDDAIKTYYTGHFLPKLAVNAAGGVPEFAAFKPTSQSGRYLQYHYLTDKPEATEATEQNGLADAGDGSEYSRFHADYHKGFRDFLIRFGYYDVFLIDFDTGEIVYSVAKEVDYGTNLLTGPYRNSGLADVVRSVRRDPVRNHVKIVDFAPYAPSYNEPASFVATPIYNGQHIVGILAFQIPVDKIQNIMTSNRNWRKEGMGESGETYIVGNDYLMRSDSRFLLETKKEYFQYIRDQGLNAEIISLIDRLNTTILLQPVKTEGARAALSGNEGYMLATDYRGVNVLSTYGRLNIEGLNWGIISEINQDEAFSPIGRLLQRILISTAVFIPIVAYLSFWLSQQFLRPVQSFVETARQMRRKYASNDHDAADALHFIPKGASEYQKLGAEMNHIIAKVREDMVETRQEKKAFMDIATSALPLSVAERLRSGENNIFDRTKSAAVIFVQITNFQSVHEDDLAKTMSLQKDLDHKALGAAQEFGIDLFPQMGMELVGICGLTMPYLNPFERIMNFADTLFGFIEEFNAQTGAQLHLSIGIDVGPLYGGLQKGGVLDYDVLGDPIYIAREVGYTGPANSLSLSDGAAKMCQQLDLQYELSKLDEPAVVDERVIPVWTVFRNSPPLQAT